MAANAQGVQRKLDEEVVRAYVVVAILKYTHWGQQGAPKQQLTLCSKGQPLSKDYLASAVSTFAHPYVDAFSYYDLDESSSYILSDGTTILPSHCDVLVVGPRFDPDTTELKTPDANQASLTKGETNAFYICDGLSSNANECAVELGLTRGKVSFSVNLNTAESSGTVFSSSLLELAEKIEGRP